jgi:hypothetical protein
MAYVYKHLRNDTNEVFYIGIGKNKSRVYSNKNRNEYWKNIVQKVGFTSEIVANDISWECACDMERQLIKEYGRWDLGLGNLVNMTDGGEGFTSLHSESTKKKMSEAHIGKKRKPFSDETRLKIGKAVKNRIVSDASKQKMRDSKIGKTHSEETKQKMRDSHKFISDETKLKLSKAMKGRVFSDEHILNLKNARKLRELNKNNTI